MIKRTALATAALVLVAGLTACSNPTGKSWAISYELTGQSPGSVTKLSYAESVDRYQDQVSQHELRGPLGLPWRLDVVVSAGQEAKVTATPSGDAALTCRILLDETRELAKTTAAAGQPVICAKTTDS
ncbi:hypothetical protein [Amycolatopsis sp. PS_44_ISF1]|uniref:hypothetical protein n=1 Tax=Amycolatopsis sp. PS_44_ISF1 TaxID=2974917 RepID=UPI0028DF4BA2|nr:hypothetical protein [Amycolatopsis sp. PS_44_ISF1]MDT8914799.1 hypothetical protein [Amycolatopsis sp. PS_44_ISF1]